MNPPSAHQPVAHPVQGLAVEGGFRQAALEALVELLPHFLLSDEPGPGLQYVLVVTRQAFTEPAVTPTLIGDQQVGQFMVAGPVPPQFLCVGGGRGKKLDPDRIFAPHLRPGMGSMLLAEVGEMLICQRRIGQCP